tara:strand:- start:1060 stop:1302 length:243 start_codon:yes stop_codon:yes gene_type:complete
MPLIEEDCLEEIISCLAKCGRPDLINDLVMAVAEFEDKDYKPPPVNLLAKRRDSLSDSEGSAFEEDVDYEIDSNGFYSLK